MRRLRRAGLSLRGTLTRPASRPAPTASDGHGPIEGAAVAGPVEQFEIKTLFPIAEFGGVTIAFSNAQPT